MSFPEFPLNLNIFIPRLKTSKKQLVYAIKMIIEGKHIKILLNSFQQSSNFSHLYSQSYAALKKLIFTMRKFLCFSVSNISRERTNPRWEIKLGKNKLILTIYFSNCLLLWEIKYLFIQIIAIQEKVLNLNLFISWTMIIRWCHLKKSFKSISNQTHAIPISHTQKKAQSKNSI